MSGKKVTTLTLKQKNKRRENYHVNRVRLFYCQNI